MAFLLRAACEFPELRAVLHCSLTVSVKSSGWSSFPCRQVPGEKMRLHALVLSSALLATALPALAQTVSLQNDHVDVTELAGPWRFHTGDNGAWANPNYDDSGWALIKAGQSWDGQGYSGYDGFAWYRLAITHPTNPQQLAFYIPYIADSYQIFANGSPIGQVGAMPPHAEREIAQNVLFPIPEDASTKLTDRQPLVLAVRVWHNPTAANLAGGMITVPAIGDAQAVAGWMQMHVAMLFHRQVSNLVDIYLDLLTALAGFGLFWLRRNEREYLWWGISQLLWAAFIANMFSSNFRPTDWLEYLVQWGILFTLASAIQFKFYVTFLRQRQGWLFWAAILFLLVGQALRFLRGIGPLNYAAAAVAASSGLLTQACVLGILWIGARQRKFGARLLLLAYGTAFLTDAAGFVSGIPFFSASHWTSEMRLFLNQTFNWPFPIGAPSLTGDFEMFAVVIILVLSYVRSRRDEERLESELEGARAVQKILIPNEVPTIPGFQVQAVYKPASQVGGDFFQIIGTKSGGVLIAIGDVSGKGMPAAMTVSLLVGTLRTLAHYTESPADILRAMNQRMLARSDGGFTTCLVMRVERDGGVTAANAGHLAPYLDGREVALEHSLPLGLAADSQYTESNFLLKPDQQLTLLTDGVPEARNAAGKLLGFEATAALSAQSAQSIADTARRFGQDDDVTVVQLALAFASVTEAAVPEFAVE